ncbi:hypothetical protein [Streptomyces pini]|uniref:Uncharacterized protein n=1 Tax=Streptomyces pini TaxID=1520580 RepID=A0A1I3U1G2_9ACTN|nr:hypothetical protein [Streptomyces pini]SFJ77398.1 hypothetical protein SAMN05192584_101261 [Streptomyces pini]
MEAIAALIAVLGTLLGSGITYAFQRRTTAYGEELARRERLRQERIDAYCLYAGALHNYRRMLVHRWFAEHERPGEEDTPSLLREIYRLRSEAHESLFRVQLLTRSPELEEVARSALETVTALHGKELDRRGLDALRTSSKQAIEGFVTAAAPYVGEPPEADAAPARRGGVRR